MSRRRRSRPEALSGIEQHLIAGRREVHAAAQEFLRWIRGAGAHASAAEQQRRFWLLRLRFQNALSQFDLFSEVITQRSEADNGVLLSGLDVAAAEALHLPGRPFDGPPVVCSLHRGLGGAIRRARTRLPGGGDNPVALIRIPRERMIGLRHRLLARARGRPPGRRAARAGGVAASRPAAGPDARAGGGRRGPSGTAGSPRSWPTSGRSARSGSDRRSA